MPGPAPILREIHRLRRHIKDLETKLEQGPKLLRTAQLRLANQEDQLKQAQEALKRAKLLISDKEGSVKATQAQIDKYEKQIDKVTSKKEYDTLRAEVATAKEHVRKLEDEILELMADAEDKAKLIPAAEQVAQKGKAEFAQHEKDHAEKLQRFALERDRAKEELTAVEATLPADVRSQVMRLIAAKGADALAGVQGRNCTACYTEITSQMSGDLKQDAYVICKNCGRILYLEA